MDPKEIAARVKALNKATGGGEPAGNIKTILESLKKDVVATEDVLRSTKVGVAVNRQKHHADKEVARLAGEIVSKWRDDVNKLKAGSSKKAGAGASTSTADNAGSPPKSNGQSTSSSGPAKAKAKISVPLDQRTWKSDEVDVNRTGSKTRDNCLGLLYNGLAFMSSEPPTFVLKIAVDVERAGMEALGPETTAGYREKMRSLFANLKNKSNPELRAAVLSGAVAPARLVTMTLEELKSAERRAADEKLQEANMKDAMVPKAERSISTSFVCGKCGQKKVSYSQAQTRSADEPMTTFCECQLCGNRWKFS
ncbi:MAG: RNA polymerase II elongation factor [Thelocarpon impressellum]|nr:MAG: RNA polymerase II elongation factor [Thelocarpon impressellum]